MEHTVSTWILWTFAVWYSSLLVVAEVRGRLAVTDGAAQKMDMDRLNLSMLNEAEVKEWYVVTITIKFSGLENLRG